MRLIRLNKSGQSSTACCVAVVLPLLFAQFPRVVYSGKEAIRDMGASHPLSYWTADPLDRDDGGDLCLGCKLASGETVSKADFKATSEVHRLGSIGGHEIVEVMYQVHRLGSNELGDTSPFPWKILLVGTKADEFSEIFHLQPTGPIAGPLIPAKILSISSERILATYDSDGGNGGGCWEGYWWFDGAGPHPVDFDPAYRAIGKIKGLPNDAVYSEGCWTLDLDHAEIKTDVHKRDRECHACGQLGTATVSFELHHGVAKATKVEFVPVAAE